jgi:hypothetical protein
LRFSASLAAFAIFGIQNDRNTRSYGQKFNTHISEVLERMARAPSRRRACAFLRLWLFPWISKLKMTEIHGHLNKKSTCTFPKSRNRVEKGGRAKRAPSARRTMVQKTPVISIRSGDLTVAILAQGTSWADAATQAFLQKSRILNTIRQRGC